MMRLFIGLPIPPSLSDRLAMASGGIQGARWIPRENHHVTLRFIGEVDDPTAEDVHDRLDRIRCGAVPVTVDGLGIFGPSKAPSLLFADVHRSQELMTLQRKIDRAMVGLGLGPDKRKFHPHVSLARLRQPERGRLQRFLEANGSLYAGPFEIDRFTLYRSHLHGSGSLYQPLAEYELDGGVESGFSRAQEDAWQALALGV